MNKKTHLETKRQEAKQMMMHRWHGENAYHEIGERFLGRQEMDRRIVQQWERSPEFRKQLQEDPKAALEGLLGITFPEKLKINVHHQGWYDYHVVIPHIRESEEIENDLEGLSEEELEAVAANFNADAPQTGTATLQHYTYYNRCVCCC